ncbi:hypothetical protein RJ639_028323 [Escallonia herrerae]|uniref:Transposase (putative) gypsy type domain-containing protein n=1 Tax=Escallonia herrerae TaxID=1293975 RepID=A0AA89BP31_9ASTE|nr:hypothetical protein RJ639_028323 [Escallonia herrerae]
MSESSVSVSSPEEDVVISSSSSSRSGRVSTSSSEVGTSHPQLLRPLSSEPLRLSSSQPPQPSTSQPSPSLPAKNALGDIKDRAEDKANPKPWYTADEKSKPANYGRKYETGIYEEQVRSRYRLPLHPFALRFFEHYHMALGQLVPNGWRKLVGLIYLVQSLGYKPDTTDFMRRLEFYCKDFENPGKPAPNNLTKHILSHIKIRGGLSIDEPLSKQQPEWVRIIPRTLVPAGAVTPPPAPTISSTFPAESASLEMASGSGKMPQGGFLGVLQKAKGKRKEKQPSAVLPPAPKKTRIVEKVSVEEDPIFHPRWTLRSNDVGMPNSQISEQHLVHGVLPRDKEIFQNQTHETFAFSFAQAVYTVAAEEAQQKRDAIKEAQEVTHRAEELSNREEDYLAKIATLEKRLERIKRKATEEVTKAQD